MDKDILIEKLLGRRKENLLKAIVEAREARDNSPSAMESHSDTSRSQNENLVIALESELIELDRYKKAADLPSVIYLEIKVGSKILKLLIVPKGLGGVEVDGVRLLSVDTPLGQLVLGKKVGDRFDFNDQELEVLKVE